MSNITKKEIEKMLDNHSKSIELSNAKEELSKVREENKQLISELASEEIKTVDEVKEEIKEETEEKPEEVKEIEEIQEKVEEVVAEGAEANEGEPTELGAVLEEVAGLKSQLADLALVVEEMSSKFKDVCASMKVVTPLEAGIGKMTLSNEEFVVVDEDGKVLSRNEKDEPEFLDTVDDEDGGYARACKYSEAEAKQVAEERNGEVLSVKDAFKFVEDSSEESIATDEEVETAIDILEKYVEKHGDLEEVKEEIKEEKEDEFESKKEEISSLRERIRKRKPEVSSKRSEIIEKIKERYSIETSSVQEDSDEEYKAGELAGKLFARKR